MADRPTPLGERPVVAGLIALTGVAVVVGLLAGITMLMGTKILGLGGVDAGSSADAPGSSETLYLPDPVATSAPSGPQITLDVEPTPASGDEEGDDEVDAEEEAKAKKKKEKAKKGITLIAGQESVTAMQRIDLSGTYPEGNGAILQVQRFEGGGWKNFPVTMSVSGGSFSTYVVSGQGGETRFRVLDTDSGRASNAVKVKIG
ncbi:hypothetical protein [Nocardioides gilvus]|uniref:hypothetical protein n=1 Tax=Nocardioides gilvus TaxID=1735589 RepID=UPI000D740EF6|nr:hypothetical protein [Nocardioides gilvus]